MRFDKASLLLYAVTDRAWLYGASLSKRVEEAVAGGATFVQLREKDVPYDEFLRQAVELRELTSRLKVPFVVNDNIDIALACGADGVHVGQSDLEAGRAREVIGPNMILGVSAQTVEEGLRAQSAGADYVGVGAVFPTTTKGDADEVSYGTLKEICATLKIPVVAIGGIGGHNIMKLKGSGIAGVAVVSAIFASHDIKGAARDLKELAGKVVSNEA